MKIFGLFLICALLSACGGGSPVTQTPARSDVVAFMGDSITQYWAPYMPANAGFTTLDVGIHGQTSAQMLARFQSDVIDASPIVGVVVIDAGINDIQIDGADKGSAEALANITEMAAMADASGIRVTIASVMLANCAHCGTAQDIEALNQQLISLASTHGYQYADYYDAMLNTDGTQNLSLYLDGVHPTEAGYTKMWAVVQPLIDEALQ